MCYDADLFKSEINENLVCSICSGVFCFDAVEDSDGHVFCRSCISQWIKINSSCPLSRCELTFSKLKPVNVAFKGLLSSLRLRCKNHIHGCDLIFTLETIAEHENSCHYRKCESCGCLNGLKHKPIDALNLRIKLLMQELEKCKAELKARNKQLEQYEKISKKIEMKPMNHQLPYLRRKRCKKTSYGLSKAKNTDNLNLDKLLVNTKTVSEYISIDTSQLYKLKDDLLQFTDKLNNQVENEEPLLTSLISCISDNEGANNCIRFLSSNQHPILNESMNSFKIQNKNEDAHIESNSLERPCHGVQLNDQNPEEKLALFENHQVQHDIVSANEIMPFDTGGLSLINPSGVDILSTFGDENSQNLNMHEVNGETSTTDGNNRVLTETGENMMRHNDTKTETKSCK